MTVALGLGIWLIPRYGILGVGAATAVSETVGAIVITAVIASHHTDASLVRPRNLTITRQLIRVSVPNFAEGLSTSLANFPLNAIILLFGTEANAAYHIGRRIFRQLTGPIYRSVYTVASIIVGQTLGEGNLDHARDAAIAILVFSVGILGLVGVSVFAGASLIVRVFTHDPATIGYATDFTRAFALSMIFIGVFYPLAGTLVGAGETRTPFYARFTGVVVFLLGVSYLLGITFGFGLTGVYVGIILSYVCWAVIAGAGFLWGGWRDLAVTMMAERAENQPDQP